MALLLALALSLAEDRAEGGPKGICGISAASPVLSPMAVGLSPASPLHPSFLDPSRQLRQQFCGAGTSPPRCCQHSQDTKAEPRAAGAARQDTSPGREQSPLPAGHPEPCSSSRDPSSADICLHSIAPASAGELPQLAHARGRPPGLRLPPPVPWATRRGAGAGFGRAAAASFRAHGWKRGAGPGRHTALACSAAASGIPAPLLRPPKVPRLRSRTRSPRVPHPGAVAGGPPSGLEPSHGAGPAAEPPPVRGAPAGRG